MSEQLRVLIIDDDPGIREYLHTVVSRQGYRVFSAVDGEEALASLPESRPNVVTLDAVLPGMDGLETLRRKAYGVPTVGVIPYVPDLTIGEETRHLKAGDPYLVPGNVEHGVITGPTPAVALDVFNPPREDYMR